jgi:tripeptide aminopeptidase
LHPLGVSGNAAEVKIDFLLRDFTDAGLADKRRRLSGLCQGIEATEPRVRVEVAFESGYRNMAKALRADRRPLQLALEATRLAGLKPASPPIRGGTDGTQLSGRGLPTPNLSCGQHNVHGPLEWVAVEDMASAVQVCLNLVQMWAVNGNGFVGYQPRNRGK